MIEYNYEEKIVIAIDLLGKSGLRELFESIARKLNYMLIKEISKEDKVELVSSYNPNFYGFSFSNPDNIFIKEVEGLKDTMIPYLYSYDMRYFMKDHYNVEKCTTYRPNSEELKYSRWSRVELTFLENEGDIDDENRLQTELDSTDIHLFIDLFTDVKLMSLKRSVLNFYDRFSDCYPKTIVITCELNSKLPEDSSFLSDGDLEKLFDRIVKIQPMDDDTIQFEVISSGNKEYSRVVDLESIESSLGDIVNLIYRDS